MASARTRVLLAGATFLGGILAGGAVDRVIVGGPAWHALEPQHGRNIAVLPISARVSLPIRSRHRLRVAYHRGRNQQSF